jgi:predicted phage terminase large subunit-like protein
MSLKLTEAPASPAAFAIAVSRGHWWLTRHLALLDRALVYLAKREAAVSFIRELGYEVEGEPDDLVPFTRLIVEMPPRHGKSEMISRYFPAWYLGCNPHHNVILTSYADTYARSYGRKARELLREHGRRFFGVGVQRNTEAANDWGIEGTDGGMITAGVGGPITGHGANLFITDDTTKNAEQAASPTIQQRNNDWWDSTAYTRLEPGAVVVIVATRWNAKDLIGHILASQEEDEDGSVDAEEETWYVLKLPALAEAGDVLGRKVGEALWPERYPASRFRRIARRIGSYFFNALYQQRPSSEEGGIFKRGFWQFYDYDKLPGPADVGGIFVDTAGFEEQNTSGDPAVIAVVVKIGTNLYWRDVQVGYWEFPALVQRLKDAHDEHSLPVVIEETPWAKPLIQSLKKEISGVIAFKIEGKSKVVRAQSVQPYHEGGNFFLPRRKPWVSPLIDEHADFPTGKHDDQVDTTSMAGMRLILNMGGFRESRAYWSEPAPRSMQRRFGAGKPGRWSA